MNVWGIVGLLVLLMAPLSLAQTNLYKLREGTSVTRMGEELITFTTRMCDDYGKITSHFTAMTNQRDSATDYTTMSQQWGVLDPSTNAVSEPHAEALYTELNSLITIVGSAMGQWCGRIRQ